MTSPIRKAVQGKSVRPSYMVKKWNYDPASTRRARKALAILEHAKDYLMRTGLMDYPGNFIDLTLETRAAWTILGDAGKNVVHADDTAQQLARLLERAS